MKNLFKFVLLGAFTFSLAVGFVGCKNYDKDIEEICERLDNLDDAVRELQEGTGGGVYVTDVTTATDGITVHYSNNTTKIVEIGPASGLDAYVTEDENGGWVLHIKEQGSNDWIEIALSGAASALSKIDILGWTSSYGITGNPDGNIALTDPGLNTGVAYVERVDPFPIRFAYIEHFKTSPAAGALFAGADEGGAAEAPNTAASVATNTERANPDAWAGGKIPVNIKTVLNTLGAERRGIVVEVFPATVDLSTYSFEMYNNQGKKLPIAWDQAEPITGLVTAVTRAAEKSALYFIPGDYDGTTYESAAAYEALVDGTGIEKSAYALYTAGENGVKVSEFTSFQFDADEITSTREVAVKTIKSTDGKDTPVLAPGSYYTVKQNVAYEITEFNSAAAQLIALTNNESIVDYYLEVADPSKLDQDEFVVVISPDKTTFTVTRLPDALTVATFDLNVYKLSVNGDIYKETIVIRPVRTGYVYTEALGNNRIIDADKKSTGFSDGVTAYNVANNKSASKTFSLAGMFADLATKPFDNSTLDKLWKNAANGAQTYQLKGMKIGGVAVTGLASDPATDLGKWVAAFEAAGGAIEGYSNADGTGTLVNDTQASGTWNTANSIKMVLPYAFADNTFDNAGGGGWDASKYGYTKADDGNNLADAAWVVGKEYEFTMDFVNQDGDYINTLVVTITPTIPSLSDMIARQDAFWTGNVLNAYYKAPAAWATSGMSTRYDITPPGASGYTGDTGVGSLDTADGIEGTFGDGGFTKLGGGNDDTEWANVSFALDADQKIGEVKIAATAAASGTAPTAPTAGAEYGLTANNAETANNHIFELYWQNDADKAGVKSVGTGVDGIKVAGTGAGAVDAYGVALNVKMNNTKYLGLYPYPDADYAAAAFQIKIMSALYEGEVLENTEGGSIEVAAAAIGEKRKITTGQITGYNYNKQTYNVFKKFAFTDANAMYDYTYVREVWFKVPGATENHPDQQGVYTINGGATNGDWVAETAPVKPAAADQPANWGYIEIVPGTISNTTNTWLDVKVIDRFGKVKTAELDMTIYMED